MSNDKMNTTETKIDEMYMRRCIQLARCGEAGAPPNPMVGAVIVHDGRIIGEGYHRRCGGPHAEVNAIRSVRQPELLCQSTIYVSLEPCAHHGKTPPCADLIVEKRIPRVVIGCKDPFAKVNGLGIKKLLDAGIEVKVGVLEQECIALNHRFMTFHQYHRPYIILKWAQSSDGFIADAQGKPVRFSTPATTTLVHRLRAQSDAVLVGGRTALNDDPSLTVRNWHGTNPMRVVIDTHGTLPLALQLFGGEAETMVWQNWDLSALMQELYDRGVQQLLVEGGAEVHRRFIEAALFDEIRVETSPKMLGEGVKAAILPPDLVGESTKIDGNTVCLYKK